MADQDSGAGGEISLSIEESNKLRISLGLKPLKLDSGPSQADKERQNHEAKKKEAEAEAQAAELRKKIDAAREKRVMEAKLKAVKTLGAADDDDGDMAAWVEKNRRLTEQRKQEEARKREEEAKKAAAKRKKREDSDDEGEYKAADLEGLKVKTDLGEVGEGETIIVTLADKSLLDEQGQLRDDEDELEHTLLAEEKRRRKARKASVKEAKPLWEEDGKVRTLLDKYDEEEAEVAVALGSGGTLEAERVRRAAEMRKKLEEANAVLAGGLEADKKPGAAGGDYYTPAEMAAFSKPKKKKTKGERRIRAKSVEPEGGDVLAELEAQAAEGAGASDLGRREDRGATLVAKEAAARIAAEDKRARFEAAVQKANWASQFLRPSGPPKTGAKEAEELEDALNKGTDLPKSSGLKAQVVGDDDEEDRELRESLERARRLAQKKREEEEAAKAAAEESKADGDMDVDGAEGDDKKAVIKGEPGSVAEVARLAAERREREGKAGKGIGVFFADVGPSILCRAAAAKAGGSTSVRPGTSRDGAGGSASPEASGRRGAYDEAGGSDLDDDGDARMGDGEAAGADGQTGTWVSAEGGQDANGDGTQAGGRKRERRGRPRASGIAGAALDDSRQKKRRGEGRGGQGCCGESKADGDMDVDGAEGDDKKPSSRRARERGRGVFFADVGVVKPEPGEGKMEMLTETMEFVRNITALPSSAAAAAAKAGGSTSVRPGTSRDGAGGSASPEASGRRGAYDEAGGSDLDDDGDARMGDGEAAGADGQTGTWVSAEGGQDANGDGTQAGGRKREGSTAPEGGAREKSPTPEPSVMGERAVGRGLAGALSLLNEKGALREQVEWAGRNGDKSKNAVQGLEDVYTGGRNTDRVARSVEAALTVRDHLGRVKTPKERFRELCYGFHGIKPSKNKVDKKAHDDAIELAIKRAATTEDPSAELDRLKALQRVTGSAHVVLSGKNAGLPTAIKGVGGGDSDDEKPAARKAPKGAKGGMPPPGGPVHPLSGVGGKQTVGNLTPLLGDRKVEAFYGIKKPPKPPGAK
ncbi:hypothetical protein HYH03_011665 [Edaphochlamys debaryana]|uniref:Uncharacterized protein n=1 Tax=Edaphochlamys debaryana TaxID=47281 RepID=A0A835XVK4_9CHLO|nr:hypothetical protein HYH03_011665 [Edaphochlamys debaryana]|eukprot:KAG2489863.1 hypothetical protein HYH03_011665 [Edaphochlamys debaryana]